MKPVVAVVAVAAVAVLSYVQASLQPCPDLSQDGPDIFDFVVVGSGAGGGPVAARLAENGFSVFIVDAGNDVNIFNTTLPAYWGRATEDPTTELAYNIKEFSDPDSRIAWYPRARALGGSTIHNAMINIIAGTRTDFDGIADTFDDPSWSRKNMQEYFKKIEMNQYLLPTLLTLADHGFKGWLKTTLLPYLSLLHDLDVLDPQLLTIVAAFVASPNPPILDLNSLATDSSVGINTPSFTVDDNHIRSSVYNRLTAVKDTNRNLNTTLDTLATRILMCSSDGIPTAYGVEIAPGAALPVAGNFEGKQDLAVRTVMARHEVIVSAGVFQSPQLLMLSGIGNSSELNKFGIDTVADLPGVGTNLQDHDEITITWKLKDEFKLFNGCKFLSDPAKDPCLADWIESNHMNLYAFSPVLDAIITKSSESQPVPDILTYAFFEASTCLFRFRQRSGFPQQAVDNPNGLTAIVLKAHPSSRGFVRLTGAHPQDPLDIEKMHFEAEEGPEDMEALVDGITRIRALVENSLIAAFIVEEDLPGKDANLTQYILDRAEGDQLSSHHRHLESLLDSALATVTLINAAATQKTPLRYSSRMTQIIRALGHYILTPTLDPEASAGLDTTTGTTTDIPHHAPTPATYAAVASPITSDHHTTKQMSRSPPPPSVSPQPSAAQSVAIRFDLNTAHIPIRPSSEALYLAIQDALADPTLLGGVHWSQRGNLQEVRELENPGKLSGGRKRPDIRLNLDRFKPGAKQGQHFSLISTPTPPLVMAVSSSPA
ncbi:hypothetical protein C8R43DRAFT_1109628 [Mycena crocata]|nr:hypothetical protein C8R43DRAFT_1109628 [Mycena crocata]